MARKANATSATITAVVIATVNVCNVFGVTHVSLDQQAALVTLAASLAGVFTFTRARARTAPR